MNIQELKNKMNNVPDHKMNHDTPMNKPLNKMKHHDISTGKKAPKAKALEGARTMKPNEGRDNSMKAQMKRTEENHEFQRRNGRAWND
jgi:hypothetical protein